MSDLTNREREFLLGLVEDDGDPDVQRIRAKLAVDNAGREPAPGDAVISKRDGSGAIYLGPNLDAPGMSVIQNECGDLFHWADGTFEVRP